MKRLDFLSPARASQFQGADSGIECWALWHDGATLWMVLGGQTGNWSGRDLWVYDRLPGGPHADKAYSGYWGKEAVGAAPLPYNLGIPGAAPATTGAGFELLRVPAGAASTATWQALPIPAVFSALAAVSPISAAGFPWRAQLLDAATGAILLNATSNAGARALPALASGQCAILRVQSEDVAPTYAWPPPSYRQNSGESSDTPARFAWSHPTRGTLYFDPRFAVGARPYNRADPVQAALLDGEAAARDAGTARKVTEWISYLVEFDATGNIVGKNGEWAMMRIVAGDGAWIGDKNVHVGATLPALWRAQLDPDTLAPLGVPVPWVLDPTLRNVASLEVTKAGALLIGGAVAGSNGPAPIILEIQPGADVPGDEAATPKTRALFACECATPLGKTVCSLAETQSGVRATSPCDSFLRDISAPLFKRLIPSHPGGRNAIVWANAGSERFASSTEGGDFGVSLVHQKAHGYVVIDSSTGKRLGAPLAKQLDSCLATLGARVFGIEEWSENGAMPAEQGLEDRLQSYQALGASLDGAQWERLASWQVGDFDAGPVSRCGSKKSGAALWAFGTTGEGTAMKPRALRLQGGVLTQNIDLDYFIQRAQTFSYRGEEWICAVGLRHDAVAGFGDREQYLLLSRGDEVLPGKRVCAFWNEAAHEFRMSRSVFTAAGGDVSKLPPFLVWRPEPSRLARGVWVAASAAPASGYYLQLDGSGGALIRYAAHHLLPAFDTAALLGLQLWLDGSAISGLEDGAAMTMWNDLSPRDAAALGNGETAPVYASAGLNGRSAVSFEFGQFLRIPGLGAAIAGSESPGATAFIVAAPSNCENYSLLQSNQIDAYYRYDGNGAGYMGLFRSARLEGYPAAVPDSGVHSWAIESSAAGYRVLLDGVSQGEATAGFDAGNADYYLGLIKGFQGMVGEVVVCRGILSPATRDAFLSHLHQKWGVNGAGSGGGTGNVLPYDSNYFDKICFQIQSDGSVSGPIDPDPKCLDAACALTSMPEGTRISLIPVTGFEGQIGANGQILEEAVGAVALFPHFEQGGAWVTAFDYESLYPQTLWLRADAAAPLQVASGAALSPEVLSQLQTFDQSARLEARRTLAMAAQKRVEAVLLLAPGWSLKSEALKVRG